MTWKGNYQNKVLKSEENVYIQAGIQMNFSASSRWNAEKRALKNCKSNKH